MPYTLKTQQIAVKDPDTGVYSGVDILAEQTTEGLLTEITATGEAVKADVSAQMATERSNFNTYVSGKEAELDQYKSTTETNINTYVTNKNQEIATMIADADEDVSDLEDRKQDVADAVAGMLSKGVDNTLTTANVPAESKATGDLFETIVQGKSTQPNDKWNRLWIKPSASDYEIPTMDEFNDLKSVFGDSIGNEQLDFSSGFIKNNVSIGDVVDTDNILPGSYYPWIHAITPCSQGDLFLLTANGGEIGRVYSFLDSEKKAISIGEANKTLDHQVFIAPNNAAYLIVNDNSLKGSCYKYETGKYLLKSFGTYIQANNIQSFGFARLSDIPINTIAVFTGDVTQAMFSDLPEYGKNVFLMKFSAVNNANTTLAVVPDSNALYFRNSSYQWVKVATNSEIEDSVIDSIAGQIIHVKTWIDGSAINMPNPTVSWEALSTNFKRTDYIDVSKYKYILFSIPVYRPSVGTRATFGLSFYNSNKEYIQQTDLCKYTMPLASGVNNSALVLAEIPAGGVYIRTTWYRDSYDNYTSETGFVLLGYTQLSYSTLIAGLNKVVLGQDEINRFYWLNESNEIVEGNALGISGYIDCRGALAMQITMPVMASENKHALLFYADDKTTVLAIYPKTVRAGASTFETQTVFVPSGAAYFRTTYFNFDNVPSGGNFKCVFYTSKFDDTKRPYQSGYRFFSPEVNQSVNKYWETDLETELGDNMLDTTGVLLLPENYDPNGKPVPVILYFHGYSHYVYYDHWGDDEAFRTQKAQWAAQGFAVIDCNGARNNNKTGQFTSGGSLQYTDGYHKCFEYVKQHYNVEQYCHVICASAGGIPGINYCYWFNDAKSLQMLSAWTSLKNNSYATGQTASMIEYLGCDFTDGYDATADKTIGFDPTLRILTIDNTKYLPQLSIPAKAFLGSTEENNHIWMALQNFVAALRNARQSVSLRIIDGATHKNICSDDNLALNTEYANFCKSV